MATPTGLKRYSAMVLGDGGVLPIVERVGQRVIREIEPLSREGRSLLKSGRVTLWHEDGARHEAAPIAEILDRQALRARIARTAHAGLPVWADPGDSVLRRIGRMKKAFKNLP